VKGESDSSSQTATARPRGRPRSEEAHRAILEAALEVLGERGFDGLTFEAVASRAGVGRPTIYRRWKRKEELAAEAIESWRSHMESMPDTGSLIGDLDRALDLMESIVGDPAGRRLLILEMTEVSLAESLRETWWSTYIAPRIESFKDIFKRAASRGEIDPAAPIDQLMLLLSGAIIYLYLFMPGKPTREKVWETVNFILGRSRKG